MGTTQQPEVARWFTLPDEGEAPEPPASELRRLAVVGGGQMGAGIAEVAARAGLEVTLIETGEEAAANARTRVASSLERAAARGKLEQAEHTATLERLAFTTDWAALDGADAAIEAVIENVEEKRRVFALMDRHLPDAAFLASNTSSVPIMNLASATSRPERVLGLHFFNPVPVMNLVEVVPSLTTDPRVVRLAARLVSEVLGKAVIRAPDRAGFVVNALLIPYLLGAIRMLEMGPASREEIDQAMVNGCHHPMGPLRLADLIGLDTVLAVSHSLYEEFHDAFCSAPPLLKRMVEAGKFGRKAGIGFYTYDDAATTLTPAG
ncbi:MAG TPA: 3-hydroxybutyryl-CoA dehydrogenase [Solirubrobacterales bacterium]|nr:3-hydroxybutyryl-CoA dehydrogenase [Solirubrobacterales bacterium]